MFMTSDTIQNSEQHRALREQPKVKAFGSKAAITVEAGITRNLIPTLNFDMALKSGTNFNWSNKMTIQADLDELSQLFLKLTGLFEGDLAFKRSEKGIVFKDQRNGIQQNNKERQGIYVIGTEGPGSDHRSYTVPISLGLTIQLTGLVSYQLKAACFDIDNASLWRCVKHYTNV